MSLEGSACRFAGQVEVILGDESMEDRLKLDTINDCLKTLYKELGWERTIDYSGDTPLIFGRSQREEAEL